MILWIWTFIPAIFAFGRQGNRFVKEYVAVHDEPKSDYRCRGYVLINDLKLLLCENKRYNYSSGDLTVSVSVEAGLNDEPEGFSGVPTYVMWSVFRNTNLTKMTDYDRTKSDECSIRDYSTTFDFYQNATSGKDKLYNLVQQLKNTKFELQNIDKELLDDTEIHPESITLPTARNRVRYDSYANAFKGHKVVRDDSDKITDKNLILKEMINFYDKFYSSDKILVVLSQTNIYQNGEKYMELLSTIPKRKSVATKPYKIGYEIRVPDEKILQLYFPLKKANLAKDASCNYLQYYFFNTKISNGFEWMLTESDLANEVSTSCFWTSWSQKDVVFKISIKLTENGLENTGKALELIFSYLNRIKSKNIEKWVHEEVVKNMDPYATKIKWNLIEFLSEVTMSASMYGLENSLVGAPKIFDVNMIRSMLNNLNAYNFNCLHGVPAKDTDDEIRLVEMQRAMLDKLQTMHLKEADAVEMTLKNLNLEGQPCTQMPEDFEVPGEYAGPAKKLIIDQPGKKLWFLPTQPNKNATYILLAIMVRLPKETFSDIKAYANLMLMIKSMNMLVNQELLAKMSNRGCYNLLINYHHTGIEVLIYSAPENVNFIVDNIFHVLAHKRITKGVLNKAGKDFLMAFHYDDFLFAAYKNLFHTVRSIDDQMIEALKGVTFQSIEAMLKVISRQIQIEALVVANIDEKAAGAIFNKVVSQFENHGAIVKNVNINWKELLQLEPGSTYLYETKTNKVSKGENMALLVYQCNLSSTEMMAYFDSFHSFYHEFLGKDISTYLKNAGIEITLLNRWLGPIVFKVRGSMAPNQMEAIFEKLIEEKLEMALENFAAQKSSHRVYFGDSINMIHQLKSPTPKTVSDFIVSFVNTLDITRTYRAVLNAQSKQYRKLTIYFYNNENGKRVKAAVPQKVKLIKDIEAFRSEHKFVRYI